MTLSRTCTICNFGQPTGDEHNEYDGMCLRTNGRIVPIEDVPVAEWRAMWYSVQRWTGYRGAWRPNVESVNESKTTGRVGRVSGGTGTGVAEVHEGDEAIERIIETELTPLEARIYRLYRDGYSHAEIGYMTHCTPHASECTKFRAASRINEALKREFGDSCAYTR